MISLWPITCRTLQLIFIDVQCPTCHVYHLPATGKNSQHHSQLMLPLDHVGSVHPTNQALGHTPAKGLHSLLLDCCRSVPSMNHCLRHFEPRSPVSLPLGHDNKQSNLLRVCSRRIRESELNLTCASGQMCHLQRREGRAARPQTHFAAPNDCPQGSSR